MNKQFGIMAVLKNDPTKVVHVVLFNDEPTQQDWLETYTELESDEMYGLVGKKFYLIPATPNNITDITFQAEYMN